MNSSETERVFKENRDRGQENKESSEVDKELQAAAALERADFLVKEVKTSQNQMQNIIVHMQAVLQAIKELRKMMDIPETEVDTLPADQRQLEKLREKISQYRSELEKMREELIVEQIKKMRQENPNLSEEVLSAEAIKKVDELYASLSK